MKFELIVRKKLGFPIFLWWYTPEKFRFPSRIDIKIQTTFLFTKADFSCKSSSKRDKCQIIQRMNK